MTFLARERHPNIVGMYGVAVEEMNSTKLHCCILMELMRTDLDNYIFQEETKKTFK